MSIEQPQYLALDDDNHILLWSDVKLKQINYAKYLSDGNSLHSKGTAYESKFEEGLGDKPYYSVGIAFDRGLGPPLFDHLDCYGHGRCLNYTGTIPWHRKILSAD